MGDDELSVCVRLGSLGEAHALTAILDEEQIPYRERKYQDTAFDGIGLAMHQQVGWGETELPLTKHSGRNALSRRLKHLGFKLGDEEVNRVFIEFKKIGDAKKFVYDDDLVALVESEASVVRETYALEHLSFVGGTGALVPTRVRDLSRMGFRALLAATLACLMTGAVAGTFTTGSSVLFGK